MTIIIIDKNHCDCHRFSRIGFKKIERPNVCREHRSIQSSRPGSLCTTHAIRELLESHTRRVHRRVYDSIEEQRTSRWTRYPCGERREAASAWAAVGGGAGPRFSVPRRKSACANTLALIVRDHRCKLSFNATIHWLPFLPCCRVNSRAPNCDTALPRRIPFGVSSASTKLDLREAETSTWHQKAALKQTNPDVSATSTEVRWIRLEY